MGFKTYLAETFVNLFTPKDKDEYKDEVWDKLQAAYKPIGGLKGSGFNSKDDMKNIKMWKLAKVKGEVVAGLLYKDKDYRKLVAVFTDGTKEGKQKLREMSEADFKRSAVEASHSLLKFYERSFMDLVTKYTIKTDKVQELLKKPIEIIDDNYYYRTIGSEKIKKRMLGSVKAFK